MIASLNLLFDVTKINIWNLDQKIYMLLYAIKHPI